MSRTNLIINYLKNKRLDEYRGILTLAVEQGYQVISLRDFTLQTYREEGKVLILRHDVDHDSPATNAMVEIEKQLKVHASYYFRNSTLDLTLMQEIEDSGSEASLHFETIADFAKRNQIQDRETLFRIDFQTACLQELKADLDRFRNNFGFPCLTIASHGDERNRKLGVPNNFLTEDISTYSFLGIRLEAYDATFLSTVNSYISDTVQEENQGFRYGVHPAKVIREEHRVILFLTHPNHWYYSPWQRIRKIIKLMIRKPVNKPETFNRI